ncbi:MAG TPA: protein kinase [Gemmataceae bacterium]|nr:protein kinase [Gemmataceae bacterium]
MSSGHLAPTARIGKYEVQAHIATGGMGAVYKAVDVRLGRVVALKVLAARLLAQPNALERFRREARTAARLNHPNIVTLYEWDRVGDSYYLAMEFVDGPDLADYIIHKGKLDADEARAILIQATQALDHAFTQGVIHRDVKPSNFLLGRHQGELIVKMTDLGLSRTVADEEYRVTRDGSTVGTVDYLSPEQSRDSSAADIRSDIYSLGCTAYHMLTGDPPFAEGGLGERVYKHMYTEPADIRRLNRDVPAGLWTVIKKMLAKDPEDRYQTPAELLKDLQHLPTKSPKRRAEPLQPPDSGRLAVRPPETTVSGDAPADSPSNLEADPDPGLTTPAKRVAAARQFERATEVAAAGDNDDYARHLLLSCCRLDPCSIRYRQALRQLRRKPAALLSRLTAPLGKLAGMTRVQAALRKGDYLKVLDLGEAAVASAPNDIATHLAMSTAAEALDLPRLAFWLAEQAAAQDPESVAALRATARLHERLGQYSKALRVWGQVRQKDPSDPEAMGKMNDLAAQETIERGNYKGRLKRSSKRSKPPTDY